MFNLSYVPLLIPRQEAVLAAIDSRLRRLLILLISAYQTYLSPHKGYSCAHRLLHGGESCSCHVKNALTETDLLSAIAQSKRRFAACNDAAATLAAQANSEDDPSSSPTHYPRRTFIYYSLVGFTLPFFVRRNQGQCCASLGKFLFRENQRRQREDQQRRYYQDRQRGW
ncbi:membrane protein insertion efficiency factor YidD [Geitlerinema sp. P-1104]|uniref:membrane protein insertion efficiency factor YidD n=1 Tax=Geitlerinema sp. P-1104 TaxID=2546230 RepID=UPI0014770926|nr:membrane protein insertion efficiency factor YidD [Geitlerinema sp. P-1104]NMG58906.1 membrane protein insertion efficiency factor YidD [Geitlerinema sp. P-1104]